MNWEWILEWAGVANLLLLLVVVVTPPAALAGLYLRDRMQSQHAVLRNLPLLGRLRYVLEHVG